MILETEAFKFVEAFSGHWIMVAPIVGVICLVAGYLLHQASGYDTGPSDFFTIAGIVFVLMGTVLSFMMWGLSGSSFNEQMFAEDTGKLGFEQVRVIEEEKEFVGSIDGKFVTCAMLETDEEYKYRLFCDN